MKPLLSYLVTFYNGKEYVSQCLESILQQNDSPNFEILLGDDGSTDGTTELLQEYVNRYPTIMRLFVITRNPNENLSNRQRIVRNKINLLRNAQGDYIHNLDGDDYLVNPNFAHDAVELLEKHKNYIGCGFNYQMVRDGIFSELLPNNIPPGPIDTDNFIAKTYISATAFIFRNVLKQDDVNMAEKYNLYCDTGITLLFLNKGPFYFLGGQSFAYRQTGTSVWTSITKLDQTVDNASWLTSKYMCAPKYKRLITVSLFYALKRVWKNRKTLNTSLSTKVLQRINHQISIHNFKFMIDILNWNNLSVFAKLLNFLRYYRYRWIAKSEGFMIKLRRVLKIFKSSDKPKEPNT